ncbi:hypothetical protein CKAH01_18581 [Colletotrichum kahawae]|uniref:Uncharacterized protein n=1 Tax=Colletotrichum kahawae TaxID=34407 RepID=A0AAE0D3S6_COLKA|nr:hypothetical protein CKAH01_18581 [Colletotrichum kahawae]
MSPTNHPPKAEGASLLMSLFSTSFVAWLLIGALAHADRSFMDIQSLPPFVGLLSIILVTCLILAIVETEGNMPRQSGVYYTAAMTGLGASASYCLVTTGWESNYNRIFWALGGIYGGLLLETSTGLYTFFARWLDACVSRPELQTEKLQITRERQ